ncbi:MAG TPA: hypothetical protein PLO37_18680 [Candidatus Hydrogenedentes bacterium]|nr:hypothetical protein [Candidatus Hydrogenedentota bacterium]HPG68877.1 hypothetical protein [Candidatus Hydrogenedentota bacterium]
MLMARVWPIVCEYGIGAVLCAIGLWCGLRSGYLDIKNRDDRRAIYMVVIGFLAMLALVAAFTFWLPYVPKGAMP